MADRENSAAFAMLTPAARRVFAAIQAAIGGGESASVTYVAFTLDMRCKDCSRVRGYPGAAIWSRCAPRSAQVIRRLVANDNRRAAKLRNVTLVVATSRAG